MKPVFIGIAGGTGSGKSTIAKEVFGQFNGAQIAMLEHDCYYKDQSSIPFEERIKTNYDHPDALETELLIEHIRMLSNGQSIEKPLYDFAEHTRMKETVKVDPRDIIIVEGIMILDDPILRDLLDIKIYVDTDADVRIIRRIVRDINERGRTVDSVIEQYLSVVRPMHMQFVEPTKRHADIIIPEGGHNRVAIEVMVANIKHILQQK